MTQVILSLQQIVNLSDRFVNNTNEVGINKYSIEYKLLHNCYWYGVLQTLKETGIKCPTLIEKSLKDGLFINEVLDLMSSGQG